MHNSFSTLASIRLGISVSTPAADPLVFISAFAAGGEGRLKLLNRHSALGSASCYLEVDATGRTVLVANYSTGSVTALPAYEDGSLGEATSFVQHTGSSIHTHPHANIHF